MYARRITAASLPLTLRCTLTTGSRLTTHSSPTSTLLRPHSGHAGSTSGEPSTSASFIVTGKSIPVPENVTFSKMVLDRFSIAPEKAALIDYRSGETFTYRRLGEAIQTLAASLAREGVCKGKVVSVCSPNYIEAAMLLLAVPATGATMSTLNPQLVQSEFEALLDLGPSQYLITTPELLPEFRNRSTMFEKVFTIGRSAGLRSVQDLLEAGDPSEMPDPEVDHVNDTALIAFSSGTTGLPKGVCLSHYNMVAAVLSLIEPPLELIVNEDVFVNVFPFAHIGGVAVLSATLYSLATAILLAKFDFEDYLKANEKHKASKAIIPPSLGVRLLNDPLVDSYDLTSVKTVIGGAAPISEIVQRGLLKRLNLSAIRQAPISEIDQRGLLKRLNLSAIRQAYGMTELSGITSIDHNTDFKFGSAGLPLPNLKFKIVDPDTGYDLPPTSTGEVWMSGPHMMQGYLNNPKATAEIRGGHGWIRSGDIGHFAEDGHLFITDRYKDLIKVKSLQVAPAELEGLLLGHPLVADAAVIGVADAQAGEVPRACIVLKPGAQTGEATEKDIIHYVADRVAPYKQLRGGVRFVDSIPKLSSGKILRRQLRKDAKIIS